MKIDDIKKKIEGTEFNVEPKDEDKKISLREGYKVMVAHLRQESESHTQESSEPNEIQEKWLDEK